MIQNKVESDSNINYQFQTEYLKNNNGSSH